MATASSIFADQDGGPMTMLNTNHPPLRKAVYISVADLTSPYNIDQNQLEEELVRSREERDNPAESSLGVPAELDTSAVPKRLQAPRGGYNLCL